MGVPAKGRRAGAARPAVGLYDRSFASRLRRDQRTCLARLSRRDTLLDMVAAVHASLEPELIARAVVDRAASWIPAACWAVVGVDAQEQLSVLAESGLTPPLGPPLYGVAGWVLRHEQPFFSGDLRADSRLDVKHEAAVVALPLRGPAQIVGAFVGLDGAVSPESPEFTPSLGRAFGALLGPAGFALDAALLLKRTEALSVTDDLTRLYNARYLNLALRRESRLAMRNSRPLSLLFIDLDGFKSINDSHGHLAGSRALVEAGAVIRGSARETDIVARFGGDEFALILPDTGSPGALAVAERIRERIARHSFLAGDGLSIHLTASVGVATLPDVAVAADELVQAADAAMYRVKDRGKNGIQAAISGR
jgi:two-component system, cell cycle response regulator